MAAFNDLLPSRVRKAAGASWPLVILDETDSTNARMKAWARGEDDALFPDRALPAMLIAGRQTAGRGRLGRRFYSPDGTGLYMTIALPPVPGDAPPVTIAAAVAVAGALEARGFAPAIKWVNDLFLNHKKICGILAEIAGDAVIVGIGVNILAPEGGFPEDIRDIAGALNRPVRRDELAGDIAARLIAWTRRIDDPCLIAEYAERMPLVGREITYQKENMPCSAVVLGVDSLGGLIVRAPCGGQTILRAGEISLGSGRVGI